jgi:thiol-disulfide isomerase/thioredoxin
MATYKNGHKKQGNDKFFSYVLIGFAVAFFVILISMILFNAFNKTLTYDSFETVDDYLYIQTQEEDQYLVYWYSEICPACTAIKDEVLEFSDSNEAGIKVYFMDSSKTSGTNYIQQMTGTPSVVVVVDGIIVDLALGNEAIPQLFDAINSGTYSNID